MYNNNLIVLLRTFSKKEIREFSEFLSSSYYNKRKAVKKLYELLIKYYPDFGEEKVSKVKIFGGLFPGKKYSDSSLRVLIHYLTDLAEKFITLKKFESNKVEYSLQLQNVLFERNHGKLFEKSLNKTQDILNSMNTNAEDFFFNRYRLVNQSTYYRFAYNYAYTDRVLSEPDWENVFKDLTNYYMLKSMIMYLNTLNMQKLYNKKLDSGSLKSFIDNADFSVVEEISVIKMYYFMVKMKTDIKHEFYYFKLKDILLKSKKDINKYDLTGAYIQMEFYCNDRIIEGKHKYERERFELFKEELKEKTYMMSDNSISPVFYRNVVYSGLHLKEFKWVKDFIYGYKQELNKKYRENYFYYCLSLYEFNNKNFEYSLELLSKIKYDEVYMKLNSKILHLQLFYESGYEDTLISSLENFRHFLNNDRLIPETKKTQLYSFHKFLSRISSERIKKNRSECDLLYHKILRETNLLNKDWLLEKVKSL